LQLHDLSEREVPEGPRGAVIIGSKRDLSNDEWAGISVSTLTGQGIQELLDFIYDRARTVAGSGSDVLPARQRHLELLIQALKSVRGALEGYGNQLELQAEALRRASWEIGRITGQVDVEDILGSIFSRF